MKTIFVLLATLALSVPLRALDFGTHPFFKHLVGDWEAEGELTGQDNNVVKITERWTGKADAGDSFYIEGSRTVNGETQPFKWTITHSAVTDAYEAVLGGGTDGQDIRFEGSLSEVEMVMNMKAITGGGESKIELQESFKDDKKDTLETKVIFTGDQGQTTLTGTITHKRVKS